MEKLKLKLLNGDYVIHRFAPSKSIPLEVYKSEFFNICKTDEELSVVCSSNINLGSDVYEDSWSCIKVLGPLDFSLTGIIAGISEILKRAEISIFVISTFDTDYVLIKNNRVNKAKIALEDAGYIFV